MCFFLSALLLSSRFFFTASPYALIGLARARERTILHSTACAATWLTVALYALLFIRNYFKIFTHFQTRCLADRRSSQLENSSPFDGMRCNLLWLTKAVPLPNLHGSKLQLATTPRIARARTAACQLPGGPRLTTSIPVPSAHLLTVLPNVQYAYNGDR